jgi:hypothetical protein
MGLLCWFIVHTRKDIWAWTGTWRNLHNKNDIIIIRCHTHAGYLQLCTQTHHVCCNCSTISIYEVESKTFRTGALPTSTQLGATWHTDSLDMVVPPFTGALQYHNCCIDDGTSPEHFAYHLGMSHNQFPPPQQCHEWSNVNSD